MISDLYWVTNKKVNSHLRDCNCISDVRKYINNASAMESVTSNNLKWINKGANHRDKFKSTWVTKCPIIPFSFPIITDQWLKQEHSCIVWSCIWTFPQKLRHAHCFLYLPLYSLLWLTSMASKNNSFETCVLLEMNAKSLHLNIPIYASSFVCILYWKGATSCFWELKTTNCLELQVGNE